MSNILDEIIESKRAEVDQRKREIPLEQLRSQSRPQPARFRDLFGRESIQLLAEIKPEAPSSGRITGLPPTRIARVYQEEQVAGVSVLTDEPYFGQGPEALRQVKTVLRKPILRKDFIIDPYQVYESNILGADALLLIASVLDPERLRELYALTEELGMDAVVEVHSESEIDELSVEPRIIGINNRTLDGDFSTDLSVTERLANEVPEDSIVISESGIHDAGDVERLRGVEAVDGILVGTALLDGAEDPVTVRDRVRRLMEPVPN